MKHPGEAAVPESYIPKLIKAHVKDGDIKNREVDLLVRKLMREHNEC